MGISSRLIKIILMSLLTAVFVLMLAANYISIGGVEFGRSIGILYNHPTNKTWSQRGTFNNITITPAGWTFSVWGIIYGYQLAIVIYWWTLLFRQAADGAFLCEKPNLLPAIQLVWYIFSCICNACWIVLADSVDFNLPLLVPLCLLLFGITICLYGALISSYYTLYSEKSRIVAAGRCTDYWVVVGLVQNGMSLYAGWVTVASFLNLAISLHFFGGVDEASASIGSLAGIIIIVLAYAISDLVATDMVTRYVFTPHLVVIWAASGSLARNYVAGSAVSVMAIVLICLVVAALIAKIVLIVIRSKSSPILHCKVEESKEAAVENGQSLEANEQEEEVKEQKEEVKEVKEAE